MPKRFGEIAFDFIEGQDALEQVVRHGPAPRSRGAVDRDLRANYSRRTPEVPASCAMRGVDAPANAGFLDPGADDLEVGLDQIEAALQRARLQNAHNAARGEAAPGRFQNAQEGVDDIVLRARAAIRNAERNAERFGRGVEDRLDEWRVHLDLRRHHDDIVRFQIGLRFQNGEQLIVQHFHLAHRAVAGMELE